MQNSYSLSKFLGNTHTTHLLDKKNIREKRKNLNKKYKTKLKAIDGM